MLESLTSSVEPQRVRPPLPEGGSTVSAPVCDPPTAVASVEAAVSIRSNRRLQLLRGSDYAPAEAPPATDEFRLFLETHFLAYERRRLATSPGDKARSVRIAVALLGSGQPQAALDLLVQVGNEGGFWVDQCRALALAKTSRLAEAEAILQAHIVHAPQDHRPVLALGRLLLDSSRFGEAREVLRRAIEKPDADAITFNDCGVAALACGDARSALGLFRKALRRDPRCLEASNNIGVCLQLRSSSERATQAFETALAIEPSCAVVIHNLAESFILRNDFDGAIELLERHRRSAPRDLVLRPKSNDRFA